LRAEKKTLHEGLRLAGLILILILILILNSDL